MFDKTHSILLKPICAYTDACSSMLKRIKFHSDGSLLILENTFNSFTVYNIGLDGSVIRSWSIMEHNGLLIDYAYIGGNMYIYFLSSESEYEEILTLYKSSGGEFETLASLKRESYQHDMDFFFMFESGGECRLMLIRHNRLHLYRVSDELEEISVLEGRKWIISGGFAVNISGKEWDLYDSSLSLIHSFKFEEDIDWAGVVSSKDKSVIAMATDNAASEIGGLYIYDRSSDTHKIHYQRYGFFNIGIACGKVWTSVVSMYSDIGGLMIFDKSASLKFAHLRDETEGNNIRAYQPSPIIYQALSIDELPDGKALISDNGKIAVTDITCRVLQEFGHSGYDCFILSKDMKRIAFLNIVNRLYGGNPEEKYEVSIDVYSWNSKKNKARVVDLTSFRKYD